MARVRQRVAPPERPAHARDADRLARLDRRIAAGDARGLGERAPDKLAEPLRVAIGRALVHRPRVHRHELRLAEDACQRGRVVRQAGDTGRAGRGRAHDLVLRLDVPAPDLESRQLAGAADPGPEAEQVVAEHELAGIARVEVALARGAGRVRRLAEVERAVHDGHRVVDLAGHRPQEVPVGLVRLHDVRKDRTRVVDRPPLERGGVRDLAGDVRVLGILVGLGVPAAGEAVREVVAPQHQRPALLVVLGLDRGDLARDQRLGAWVAPLRRSRSGGSTRSARGSRSTASRAGSKKRISKVSGRWRWSSTTTACSSPRSASESACPSISTAGVLEMSACWADIAQPPSRAESLRASASDGTRRRVPAVTANGSSMSLNAARPRHIAASPYSR